MANKELTLRQVAMEQLQRLNKTYGYPDNKLAVQDYCAALEVMETFEGVRSLMDDLTRTEFIHMPSAASIRGMAYDRMRDTLALRKGCALCGGTGFQVLFFLVTYEGKSWGTIRAKERILRGDYPSEYEASIELRKKLAGTTVNQQVLSAAAVCGCRRAVAA